LSRISLKPNASGTGNFTIESPNSNVDRTLALPDEAGTVLTDTSDIESQVKTATNATGSAPVYACRAWVNFEPGSSASPIRNSGNVSSVTYVGKGNYIVNFSTSMPDIDYCVNSSFARNAQVFDITSFPLILNDSQVRIYTGSASSGLQEGAWCHVAIFR